MRSLKKYFFLFCPIAGLSIIISCGSRQEKLFSSVSADVTGITFTNTINETDSFNILDYLYFYNGGGVAIGDINNDGLQDVYFTSNQGSNKLYLNKGNFRFADITGTAGVEGKGNWKTGVTMADVNSDGWLDIYVSEVGKYKSLHGHNELFINTGSNTFVESAAIFGLDIEGFNTQATFFDYDKDGDLDMFLVNHSVHSTETFSDTSVRKRKNEVSGDKLFRCDISTIDSRQTIHFTEITEQAGIYSSIIGYGLNVITGDFNNDNWEDIYVSNDFHEHDYYYINNQNGTFHEMNQEAFGHESRFSMGSDAGDINNDGWLDIISLDMLPADEKILKSSASDDPLDIYNFKTSQGYHHQYSRNCLQLNVGGGKKFSDIGLFAGVAATDWSWSPLLADFDNDGIKDLFVSNGILRRPNDLDYIKFVSGAYVSNQLQQGRASDKIAIEQMPSDKFTNFIFKGTKDLKFVDQSDQWGFDEPFFSNGAAYGDLDNDGDLDLVVNHINAKAGVYQNNARNRLKNHYLDLQLKSPGNNKLAYGSKVVIKTKDGIQLNYLTATRGFQSSSSNILHFGLGETTTIDTLQIIWPGGAVQTLNDVKPDQLLTITQVAGISVLQSLLPDSSLFLPLLKNITDSILIDYKHEENRFLDLNREPLMPHEVSTQGPKLAVGDIDRNGLDDFFVCGARGQAGKLFWQTAQGKFESVSTATFAGDSASEDVNAVFFDADGDNDPDLYVVSGGNEASGNDPSLLDRLYLNNGNGNFTKKVLPLFYGNKSVAAAADFNHDGNIDLFIGGRVVAGEYGKIPESCILLNNGGGDFIIAPETMAPGLKNIGMVTDALWNDIDHDGWTDLVIAGEWMPITVYKNHKGQLQNATTELQLQNTTGLWTSLAAADLDNNGYEDFLVGNWGENSKLTASEQFPLELYVGDIDGNGDTEQILCIERQGFYYTFLGKEEIERMIPSFIRKKFLNYKSMAGKTIEDIFGQKLSGLTKLSAKNLSTLLLKNKGGKFELISLPAPVQFSPVFAFNIDDFNKDGKPDILSGGNFYGVLPYEGRYDASYGNVLIGIDSGFQSLSSLQSGIMLKGEIRGIKKIKTVNNNSIYVVARNNDRLVFYRK